MVTRPAAVALHFHRTSTKTLSKLTPYKPQFKKRAKGLHTPLAKEDSQGADKCPGSRSAPPVIRAVPGQS